MADPDRTSSHSVTLLNELSDEPYTYDFYQAVRRLDCAYPDAPQTGHSMRAADDPIRFGQEASMAFAPATLQSVELRKGKLPRLIQRFFGLFGPQGPLPLHLTEFVRERVRNYEDHTLLRFLDVFHHRMITLFYRAWAQVRPTISFDLPAWDRFGDYVGSLFGLGMRSMRHRDALSDLPKLHFAGLLACQTKSPEGLLAMLSGFFQLPVQIEEFVGQWIELPVTCRTLTGLSSSRLGMETTVGSHVWDSQQKFRVIFGPLSLADYNRMLPGGSLAAPTAKAKRGKSKIGVPLQDEFGAEVESNTPYGVSLKRLIATVRTYIGDELQWDLQLILRKEETPPLGLGIVGNLGWSTWLLRDPMQRDPDDLVLDAMRIPKNVERSRSPHLGKWDHNIMGQTDDGQPIMLNLISDEVGVGDMNFATLEVTLGEPA